MKLFKVIKNLGKEPLLFSISSGETTAADDDFYGIMGDIFSEHFSDSKNDDIKFYLDAAKEIEGWILEAACGTGRIAAPLAKAGHKVLCSDISTKMTQLCKRKMEEIGEGIHTVRAEMQAIPFKDQMEMILVPYNSFNHLLTIEDQKKTAEGFYRTLKPKGKLIMEILPFHYSYDNSIRLRKKGVTKENKKFRLYSKVNHSPKTNIHKVNWYAIIVSQDGSEKKIETSFKRVDLPEKTALDIISSAGFSNIRIFDNYQLTKEGGTKKIIMAEKT